MVFDQEEADEPPPSPEPETPVDPPKKRPALRVVK
jgi:hypothetical protein